MSFTKKIKEHFAQVLEIKKSPHSIALGFAVGSGLAILPTPGISILLGILTVLIFKKISKISLFIALAIWNPFVMIPLYALSYKIGALIFGAAPVVEYEVSLFSQIFQASRRFLVGNLILVCTISIGSYVLIRALLSRKNIHL